MKKPAPMMVSIPSASEMQAKSTVKAKKKGNLNKPWVSATFYIPRPTHKRLRDHASTYDTTIQQILEEALDMWLALNNEPPFYPEGWQDTVGKKDTLE
jgi:hypothetical protein